jgi:hypothetical protein
VSVDVPSMMFRLAKPPAFGAHSQQYGCPTPEGWLPLIRVDRLECWPMKKFLRAPYGSLAARSAEYGVVPPTLKRPGELISLIPLPTSIILAPNEVCRRCEWACRRGSTNPKEHPRQTCPVINLGKAWKLL